MYLQASHANEPVALANCRAARLGAWTVPIGVALTLAAVIFCAGRSPLSAPLSDLDLERQLMAGSDALLERMVIPPNRPDWVLSQCADAGSAHSAYDQIRKVICEASRQSAKN